MTKDDIVARIKELVPPGAPVPQDEKLCEELRCLTVKLIDLAANAPGGISDPFCAISDRRISVPAERLRKLLDNRIVLVTGGEGHIGHALITELHQYSPYRIISVDNLHDNTYLRPTPYPSIPNIRKYTIDIRDRSALDKVFREEAPDIVFHCAAQRLPAHAELDPTYTISTNVMGTKNILDLCVEHEVSRCVFSSTGKASRYMTRDVYAGSKKIAEWLIAETACSSSVAFSIARFTHVAQTSPVAQDISEKLRSGMIGMHSPDSVMFVQSLVEAAQLLLNALLLARPREPRLLCVADLGWPIEALDIAIHKMYNSSKPVALYFTGHPDGYSEPFFKGQLHWEGPAIGHPLFNALEPIQSNTGASPDVLVGALAPFAENVLARHINVLSNISRDSVEATVNGSVKRLLGRGVRGVSQSAFHLIPPVMLLQVLHRGLDPRSLKLEGISIDSHRDIAEIILKALYGRIEPCSFPSAGWTLMKHRPLVDSLRTLSAVRDEAEYILVALQSCENTR